MQVLNPNPSAVYNGMIQGTYKMATGEGIMSLWRGMSSVVVGAGPAHAVYFATYEAVKHLMGGNRVGVHHPLAAGMTSLPSDTCRLPLKWELTRDSYERSLRNYRK